MSINLPEWLPAPIPFSDFGTDVNKYLDHLYSIFKNDFINSRLFYNGKPVLFDNREINSYPACFWHLVTEDKVYDCERESVENLSLLRCERICWIRPIIVNHTHGAVSVWENIRGKKVNTIFFVEDCDYVVVLSNIKNKFYIVTAYHVNYQLRKEKLIKERNGYTKMQKPSPIGTA